MNQEQKDLNFQEQEDQFLLKMQLKESTNSKLTLDDSFRIRQLKAEVRALQEQNQILQDELKNVMEQNEKYQLLALLEKTEKLKLQEKLTSLACLQNDEKYLVRLLEQKFRDLVRASNA